METREFAIAKKGMEDDVRRMNLDPKREYPIFERINYEDSPEVLSLETESGNKLPYDASLFDIITKESDDSSEMALDDNLNGRTKMSKLLELLGPGIQLYHIGEGWLEGKDLFIEPSRISIYDDKEDKIISTIEKNEHPKLYNYLNSL